MKTFPTKIILIEIKTKKNEIRNHLKEINILNFYNEI